MNGSALAELVSEKDLVAAGVASEIAGLAACFPASAGSNMFLEFELGPRPVPAGFGLGFQPGTLDYYVAVDHWFLRTPIGEAIEAARARDPFIPDRTVDLSLTGDPDPDWVEFDITGGRLDRTPFVFFRFPSRFRTVCTQEEVTALSALFPPAGATQLTDLLRRLLRAGPVDMYRLGVAGRRGGEWWRTILTSLREDQITAVLERFGADGHLTVLPIARDFYAGRRNTAGASFALSIDVCADGITAIDVECPYVYRIGDFTERAGALAGMLPRLAAAGVVSAEVAAWIGGWCCRDLVACASPWLLRVTLHHLKFRLFGAPPLRAKAYLHLQLADRGGEQVVA